MYRKFPKPPKTPSPNARMDNIQKLVNPFQYEQKTSSNKLQNPLEFSTAKVIARPLPKYVTEAKKKFVFGDDETEEIMEATETKINPFSFPISRRYFSFPTSASIGKRQDYVIFKNKNSRKYQNVLFLNFGAKNEDKC